MFAVQGSKFKVCIAGVLLLFAVAARAQEAEEAKSVLQRVFPALVARPEGEENFRAGRVTYRGIVFNDVQGKLALTENGYFFSEVKAACYGGEVEAEISIVREYEGGDRTSGVHRTVLRVSFEVKGADAKALAADLDLGKPTGKIAAKVNITMRGGLKGLSGTADFLLTDGDLGEFPLVLKLFGLLAPRVKQAKMEEAEAHVTFAPKTVTVRFAEIRDRRRALALRAIRNGKIRYDGTLDIFVVPVVDSNIVSSVPLAGAIGEIFGALQRKATKVHVGGKLSDPKVTWAPAGGG